MKEIYTIYNDNTKNKVAIIFYDRDNDTFDSELLLAEEAPFLWSCFSSESETGMKIGGCPHPEPQYLEFWLKDRVIPENRQLLKETLQKVGLFEYNWREMIKLNHGRSVSDEFSVEVSYE